MLVSVTAQLLPFEVAKKNKKKSTFLADYLPSGISFSAVVRPAIVRDLSFHNHFVCPARGACYL